MQVKITNFLTKIKFFLRKIFSKIPQNLLNIYAQICTQIHPNCLGSRVSDVFWFHWEKFAESGTLEFKKHNRKNQHFFLNSRNLCEFRTKSKQKQSQ
jgi:hypothetical protein